MTDIIPGQEHGSRKIDAKIKCSCAEMLLLRLSNSNASPEMPKHKILIFTGPIDAFYASQGWEKLEYRSIYFEKEYLEPQDGYFQPSWMVNYPGPEVPWTRIAEYKHMPNQPKNRQIDKGTVIYREYSTDKVII